MMTQEIFSILFIAIVTFAIGYCSYISTFSKEARETWKRFADLEEKHGKN